MPKTKQQEAQEKRLQRNIRQAKNTRADAKTSGNKTVRTRPPKKGGFFAGLKTDAPQTVQQSIPYISGCGRCAAACPSRIPVDERKRLLRAI